MSVELLRSPRIERIAGVAHAFTTRRGGVSPDPTASLNLSARVNDTKACVDANRARVLAAIDRPQATLIIPKQVHGDVVVEVTRAASRVIAADGLWTRDRTTALAVLVADCVPILISSPNGAAVAVVHAGWRGTSTRIAARAVERLAAAGFAAASLVVALGPAIGPCCFVIGEDVFAELARVYPQAGDALQRDSSGRLAADLWALNRQALVAAGVQEANIDLLAECTHCQADRFFSHRREHGITGRQAGIIAPAR